MFGVSLLSTLPVVAGRSISAAAPLMGAGLPDKPRRLCVILS